ncbi:MAG: TonB family protein [Vicingus serpentipes]|nr:TonB family protein [Vicingus serpentipes]
MKLKVLFLLIIGGVYSNYLAAQNDVPEYEPAVNYGEKTELKRFLEQEMNYPENALKNNIEGTVELFFVVDNKTGATSNLEVKTSVDGEIDEEAIRLYRLLQFQPPYYKGNKATTNSSFKIKFSIKAYRKYCKKRGYPSINLNDTTIDYSSIIYQDNNVDVKPKVVFEDTLMTLSSFIYKNLKYPEGTLRLNITGVVKLYFVVEPTGRITNIKVLQDVGGGATKEAERILKLLEWEPGWKNNKKVRTSKTLEVNFNLTNDSDYQYVPGQM